MKNKIIFSLLITFFVFAFIFFSFSSLLKLGRTEAMRIHAAESRQVDSKVTPEPAESNVHYSVAPRAEQVKGSAALSEIFSGSLPASSWGSYRYKASASGDANSAGAAYLPALSGNNNTDRHTASGGGAALPLLARGGSPGAQNAEGGSYGFISLQGKQSPSGFTQLANDDGLLADPGFLSESDDPLDGSVSDDILVMLFFALCYIFYKHRKIRKSRQMDVSKVEETREGEAHELQEARSRS